MSDDSADIQDQQDRTSKLWSNTLKILAALGGLGALLGGIAALIPVIKEQGADETNRQQACLDYLADKTGTYYGRSEIVNVDSRLTSEILLEIRASELDPCDLVAEVTLFQPRGGEGSLYGSFVPDDGRIVVQGNLNHQLKPKVWSVDMRFEFFDQGQIKGTTVWSPTSGNSDPRTYEDRFSASK